MNEKLREHIETLFREAPPTKKTVELKEEILQNLLDKYNDLLAEGKSEEAAYNIAIASVGDLGPLIRELKSVPAFTPEQQATMQQDQEKRARYTSIAIALYILALVPLFSFHGTWRVLCTLGLIAAATGLLVYLNMTKPQGARGEGTLAEEFRVWRQSSTNQHQVYRSLCVALWALAFVAFFLIILVAGRYWYVAWLVFALAGAVNAILKAVFDLRK